MKEVTELTRENVLEILFNSFNYGNLGLFIGAGFSKAVINDSFNTALSWGELIETACKEIGVCEPQDEIVIGMSFPEISTKICDTISNEKHVPYEDAKTMFKKTLCNLTNWLPDEENTSIFSELLKQINPSWIITTNYDLVIERLLTGKCVTLGPNDYLTTPRGVIPIYHLHGIRLDPDSIIINQEDYVQLFRPNEYRQIKLALTIKESTTLVLGYGLGDVNVLSAVDWSKNIFKESNEYPHEIIQAIRTENPSNEPYKDKNGNIIIEIKEIEDFLQEFVEFLDIRNKEYDKRLERLYEIIGDLTDNRAEQVNIFINNQDKRLSLLALLSEFELHMVSPYIDFISACIDKTWEDSSKDGNFNAYDQYLKILLDIVINYKYNKMPPALFEFVAYSLDKVFRYIGDSEKHLYYGDSWDATRTWHNNKKYIPDKMIKELYHYSKQNYMLQLHKKVKKLIECPS